MPTPSYHRHVKKDECWRTGADQLPLRVQDEMVPSNNYPADHIRPRVTGPGEASLSLMGRL